MAKFLRWLVVLVHEGTLLARPGLQLLVLVPCLLGVSGVPAQSRGAVDASGSFDRCKVIADDRQRLDCLKKLIPAPPVAVGDATSEDIWPLVRTPNPEGGPDAVAIMRTPDTARSDADLAGLMIRCRDKPGLEVVLALVRPVPPRSKWVVTLRSKAMQTVLHAEASSAGTVLILPMDATAFTTGPWGGQTELGVTIKDPAGEIHGLIPLDGVARSLARLSAACRSR